MKMKGLKLLSFSVEEDQREDLQSRLVRDNFHRGRIMAGVAIAFEIALCAADIISSRLKVDGRFHFDLYLLMYLLMIAVSIGFSFFAGKHDTADVFSGSRLKRLERVILCYVTFIMAWGSVISLMDQTLYGQLMVYMVNMITCCVVFYLDNRKILIPIGISTLLLVVGLPFFQPSGDILIGHYINLVIFSCQAWLASRILYLNYCRSYINRTLLKESNLLLKKEIQQNKMIQEKLEEANRQLRELTLIDDLTGIPNRRGFDNYIDFVYEYNLKEGSLFSAIMIDIDFFKQYNDHYGHGAGDKVLVSVARSIHSFVRHSWDFAIRYGGEEFVFASIDTNESEILNIAERIRIQIMDMEIPHEHSKISKYMTISLGTATVEVHGKQDIHRCIELADKALYDAKAKGRNCTSCMKT